MTALELVKSNQTFGESLLLIIDDLPAQRVVAAWQTLGHHNVDRPLKAKENYESAAASLWAKAHESFSMAELATQADLPLSRCERIFYRLVRAAIIYPDGTISKLAKDLLAGQVMAHIRGYMPRKAAR
jgi:hypothetical protein